MIGRMVKCSGCEVVGRVEAHPVRGTALFDFMYMWPTCWACGGALSFAPIKGKLAPQVQCDRRCTHSKGASCTCSCGGENHGREAHSSGARK